MTETWYTTNHWRTTIDAKEVERYTEGSVWPKGAYKGRRQARTSQYEQWWPTWEEAHNHLMQRAEAKVNSLRSQLQHANGELGNIKGLRTSVSEKDEP